MELPEIELVKQRDGSVVLRATRSDGSSVWQKQDAARGAFFALHDLTHYAVETVLRVDDAFYGLLASGWSIQDTEGKSARGPLPHNALFVEALVGALDTERASGARWTAAELNESLGTHMARAGHAATRPVTDDELSRIRRRRADLFARWGALGPGESLRLSFPGDRVEEA